MRVPLPTQGDCSQEGEQSLFPSARPALPVMQRVRQPHRLLKPGPYADQPDVLAVHPLQGCVHDCSFCTSRADGRDALPLVADAALRVHEELGELPRLPRAVFISPLSDPFPPLNEVQQESARLVEVLAEAGVESWLMTRGSIRPLPMAVLADHAPLVKVTVAMTTLDRSWQRLLEPLTASPRMRLRMLRTLRRAGIAFQVALEPLIPGMTDTRANLLPLLEALADAGVRHVTVGYLCLTPHISETLEKVLHPQGLDGLALDEYEAGTALGSRGQTKRYLARWRRQHGYATVMALAAGCGISVGINPLTNPDFVALPRLVKN